MGYMKVYITAGILAGLYNCSPAIADTPCDYIHKVDSQFTKQIDKTENIDRKVFPYVEDTRKCVMTMDIFIGGVSYPGEGEFVFGPDISENMACKNAMQKAKEKVIRSVSPEILNAKTDMSCEQKHIVPAQTTPVKIEPIKVKPVKRITYQKPIEKVLYQEPVERVIYQEPITTTTTTRVVYSEPIVTERIIYTEPQYNNRNIITPNLIGTAIAAFSIFNLMKR